jgi:hypothetical protein
MSTYPNPNRDVDWGVSPHTYYGITAMRPYYRACPTRRVDQDGVQANNTAVCSPAAFGPIVLKGRTRFFELRK